MTRFEMGNAEERAHRERAVAEGEDGTIIILTGSDLLSLSRDFLIALKPL